MDLGFVFLREFGWLFRVFSRLDRVVLAIVDDPKTAFNELDWTVRLLNRQTSWTSSLGSI